MIKKILDTISFLTIIPAGKNRTITEQSAEYFPVVGFLMGIILVLFNFLFDLAGIPLPAKSGLLIIILIILNGGLHIDGFIDTMDGLSGSTEKKRILEIMKDSRIGAKGALAICCLLLLKYSLMVSIKSAVLPSLLLAGLTMSYWSIIFSARYSGQYPRETGFGKIFINKITKKQFIISCVITVLVSYALLGFYGLGILLLVAGATHLATRYINKLIGGMTGDTFGALIEIMQVVILFLGVFIKKL